MRAIPKSLLIHCATYEYEIKKDRWGEETEKKTIEMSRIRIEPSSKMVRNKNGAEIRLAATLFYDCRNSRPKDMLFSQDDVVIFNGERMKVHSIEALYDNRKLHHVEMELIKDA